MSLEENTFWLRIWQTLCALIVAVIAIGAGCTAHNNARIAEAISKGSDPIEANCAFSVMARQEICAVLSAAKTKR